MSRDYLAAARAAGKAAFERDPQAPFEQCAQERYGSSEAAGLDLIEFRGAWLEAQDEHMSLLTPRGRSLYRFRCRDRLDAWRRREART